MSLDIKAIPKDIIERARAAGVEKDAADKALSEAIMSCCEWNKDDVIRDKDTGACYRIDKGSGWFNWGKGRPTLVLWCYRVYKSGRREASSATTFQYLSNFERIGTIEDWLDAKSN